MSIFFCKRCDKINEEKILFENKLFESFVPKYCDKTYKECENKNVNKSYNTTQKFINAINYLNSMNSNPFQTQNNIEDEFTIIEYPYKKTKESLNNYSISTVKKYNFDQNINIPIKNKEIEKIFSDNLTKKKINTKKKNLLLKDGFFNIKNNLLGYYIKNHHKKNTKGNNTEVKNISSNNLEKYNKYKLKLNRTNLEQSYINLNSNKNITYNNALKINSSFKMVSPLSNIKHFFNYTKQKKIIQERNRKKILNNKLNRSQKENYLKKNKKYNIIIDDINTLNFTTLNSIKSNKEYLHVNTSESGNIRKLLDKKNQVKLKSKIKEPERKIDSKKI